MTDGLHQLTPLIKRAMLCDRHRLRRRLRAARQSNRSGTDLQRQLDKIQRDARASAARREQRAAGVPKVVLEPDLPITGRADEIAQLIREHQVVVVSGETGSGKSTQLPKLLLKMGRGVDGLIGHTQPRRLAARSVAQRVSDELNSPLGQHVGYKVRFTDKTNPQTYIKLMTDGVLLAEAARDRFFDAYDTLIIDEAHERSLNIDFLLGHIRQILPKRPDLRIVITSATIDTQRFAEHFAPGRIQANSLKRKMGVQATEDSNPRPAAGAIENGAPVVEVSGRTYPVELRYQPIEADETGEPIDQAQAVVNAVQGLERTGDILVFMPTERDIRECCERLERQQPGSDILPLYARLTNEQQQAIFSDRPRRKIVVATNVAESSLTVPGIRYVIDTGTARVSRYSPNSKVQRLPIEPVSRASCDQRKGRCGRIGPGVCVRLYSEQDYLSRDEFTTPEVMRTSLASVILQIETLRFGAIEDFPFIDPPRPSMIRDGYKTLHELGAIDDTGKVTDIGRQLARVPVDPRVARMVLAGAEEDVLAQVLVIASGLEVQDPRERPIDQQNKADQAHEPFADARSDFLAYLNLWAFYHQQKKKLSNSKLRKACKQNFINYIRMREWIDVHQQLSRMVKELGGLGKVGQAFLPVAGPRPDHEDALTSASPTDRQECLSYLEMDDRQADAIHRALLTGLLSNIASKGDGFEYAGSGGQKLHLWPGSALFTSKPKWVVAAELVETTRRYARTVGRIQPGMIEPLAGHLVKKTHSDPRWNPDIGSALCSEKVSLYGLVLVPARPVALASVSPPEARQMLIQRGLVEGDWVSDLAFVTHNRELIKEVRAMQAKLRRGGLVAPDETQYTFYDAHLPEHVVDGPTLKKWYKQASRSDKNLLKMNRSLLLAGPVDDLTETSHPERMQVEQSDYQLDYVFDPSNERDGVTLTLPREALGQIDPRRVGWLVPGLIEQKLVAMIKSLPKALRKTLSPAPDAARKAAAQMRFGDGSFEDAAAQALAKVGGLGLSPSDFDLKALPDHLQLNVRVVGEHGKVLAEGRDLMGVRRKLGAGAMQSYAGLDEARWSAPPDTDWSFGELPKHVESTRSGIELRAYPALIDEQTGVALRLVDTRGKARRLTRAGLRRLFSFEVARELRYRIDQWPEIQAMRLHVAPIGGAPALRDQLVLLVCDRAFLFDNAKILDRESFSTRQRVGLQRLDEAEREVRYVVPAALQGAHQARLRQHQARLPKKHYASADLRIQLDNLLTSTFLLETPWHRLASFPRYFAAIGRRLNKLGAGSNAKDAEAFKQIAPHWNRYAQAATAVREAGGYEPELEQYRWLIEEYRVSLFAQELGTSEKVSPQRLDAQWQKVPSGLTAGG